MMKENFSAVIISANSLCTETHMLQLDRKKLVVVEPRSYRIYIGNIKSFVISVVEVISRRPFFSKDDVISNLLPLLMAGVCLSTLVHVPTRVATY